MRLRRERGLRDKRSFFSSWSSAKGLAILAVSAAISGAVQAAPPPARPTVEAPAEQAQPVQATRAAAASAPPTPQSIAMQQDADQMAILLKERNVVLEKLNNWKAKGDKAALARIQDDLHAIDREIARALRQPVSPTSSVAIAHRAGAKTMSAAPAENQGSQTKESEKVTYEGWDIFKNFGRKGN
ncbi:hypothetical protein [Herbaspirillum seropedicae]|uniref:hypothetical protein n=1 Tax=Herbaspirillum seropedicae TaxID=964 RepID=UPI003FCEDE07